MLGDKSFEVASDETLCHAIGGARERLVVIAPAVSTAVARAIVARLSEASPPDIHIVLDADADVYRLGYGDADALAILRTACIAHHLGIQQQAGVRIGVVVADETTIVYAPVPKMVEAGATSAETPNAVVIRGGAGARIAAAAGAGGPDLGSAPQEIGKAAVTQEKCKAVEDDLKANPAQPFDIVRSLRVFNSKVQYVELKVSNYRLASRKLKLPPELLDISSDDLRKQITGRISTPFADLEPIRLCVERDGKEQEEQIDGKWLEDERKRIENAYTYLVPNFGRVVFLDERDEFEAEVRRYEKVLLEYRAAAVEQISRAKARYVETIVEEYVPRWRENLPAAYRKWAKEFNEERIRAVLAGIGARLFEDAVDFQEPKVRVVAKSIAPENVRDESFRLGIRQAMARKSTPDFIIEELFTSFDAAPSAEGRRREETI